MYILNYWRYYRAYKWACDTLDQAVEEARLMHEYGEGYYDNVTDEENNVILSRDQLKELVHRKLEKTQNF